MDNELSAEQQAACIEAEKKIKTFSYDRSKGKKVGGGVKEIVMLAPSRFLTGVVQVVKEGGENNLHYHAQTDIFYMVLKGQVRFNGPGGVVYGEFRQYQGILLPADSRYWFETIGDEELELFQIVSMRGSGNAQRVDVAPAKPWIAEHQGETFETFVNKA